MVRGTLGRFRPTPLYFQTPAPSHLYKLGPGDAYTMQLTAIRQLLTTILDLLCEEYREGRHPRSTHWMRYNWERRERVNFYESRRPIRTFFSSDYTYTREVFSADVHRPAYLIHPLLHQHEYLFLNDAAARFESFGAPFHSDLGQRLGQLIRLQFAYQDESHDILVAGLLDTAAEIDFFKDADDIHVPGLLNNNIAHF